MFKIPTHEIILLNNIVQTKSTNVLFILPGIEGHCELVQQLAHKLANINVLVYGLQYTAQLATHSIEQTANFYLNQIKNELDKIKINKCLLAGYSFGGLIAIEMCRQYESSKLDFKEITNLILFESSHKFFRIGIHVNAQKYNIRTTHKDMFQRNYIYIGSMIVYLSAMIGRSSLKEELYNYLNENSMNLDDALDKAFEYIKIKSYYTFDTENELKEMRFYLKILLLKSNSGLVYDFKADQMLHISVTLIKSNRFLYKNISNLYVKTDYESNDEFKFEINQNDYSLNEIVTNLTIIEYKNGNHFTFINENSDEIVDYFKKLINLNKSRL